MVDHGRVHIPGAERTNCFPQDVDDSAPEVATALFAKSARRECRTACFLVCALGVMKRTIYGFKV